MNLSITKEFTVDYAHRLLLNYTSKCTNLHGHTGKIAFTIDVEGNFTSENDMVIDFTHLAPFVEQVKEMLDHNVIFNNRDSLKNIQVNNKILMPTNPTAEEFTKMIYGLLVAYLTKNHPTMVESFPITIQIDFWETPNNRATFKHKINLAETSQCAKWLVVNGYKAQLFDIKMNGYQRVRMIKNTFNSIAEVAKFVETYEF